MAVVSIDIKGGLGNVMFQIATAYATSIKNKMDLLVDRTNYYGGHYGLDKYRDNILRNVKYSESPVILPGYGEKEFKFNEIPSFTESVKLSGYFQSEKYFEDFRKEILNFFSPTEKISDKLKTLYEPYKNKDTCSIHVRRGDYLHLENFHPTQKDFYYKNATQIIGEDIFYFIFSDDISWCMKSFDFIKNKIFITNLEDFEEIYLMSMCSNNIIANSSFSWWGAWMNTNDDKRIISPNMWFGKSLSYYDTSDIYCKNWIKI
jgi:hypothetical protein